MKRTKPPRRSWTIAPYRIVAGCLLCAFTVASSVVYAQDWPTVTIIEHSEYQAVNPDGSSAYGGTAPFRMRGIVLNNTEDWLDATENYNEISFNLGGQGEIFVQAVDLDGTVWDPDPANPFDDFGGTTAWMGQCYGNLPINNDPAFSYINQGMPGPRPVWYGEMDRLGFNRPGTTLDLNELVRAGDLVEIRARVNGFNYAGKHNVNELHNNISANDFEVVILQKDYGVPEATQIILSDVKDASNADIFDSTCQTGGELYQATLVEILNVYLEDVSGWGTNADLVLLDDTGRSLPIHLGLDSDFDTNPAPTGYFDIVGIMDQKGSDNVSGYRLLALDYSGISPVPEPGAIAMLATGGIALLGIWLRRRRRQR